MKTKMMQNDISTEERIDNYLLGHMTDEEKLLFEKEIEDNPSFREEIECQKHIVNAVQKVAMRDFLIEHAEQRKRKSNSFEVIFSSGRKLIWTISAAAAILFAIIGGFNYANTMRSLRNEGLLAYTNLTLPVTRDGNQINVLIEKVYNYIGNNEFEAANNTIEEARKIIAKQIKDNASTEEDIYDQSLLQLQINDLDWYSAIVLMKQGKIIKAKRYLEIISTSDSPYSENASNILINLF